ncbi:MAG: Mg-chelatase subunit ChlD/tetratricopeptide (TPR) repeat protein [Crocinitomicaceae bacterium]|jgi:Mg-chelatase subunit ChlD/tetratricopeptide (TPR) repeat protein
MKDETIGVWHDPEVEVRIVAMVLGEASDFEKAELERMIAEDSGLKQFYLEMGELHGGIHSAVQPDDDAEWKLSSERRNSVLEKLGQQPPPMAAAEQKEPSTSRHQWRSFMSIAACLLITLFIMAVMFPVKIIQSSRIVKSAPEIISYHAGIELEEQNEGVLTETLDEIGWVGAKKSEAVDDPFASESNVFPMTPATPSDIGIERDEILLNEDRPFVGARVPARAKESQAVPMVGYVPLTGGLFASEKKGRAEKIDGRVGYWVGDEESIARPEIANQVARKPSAPGSSMAKVIPSRSASAIAVPVPNITMENTSLDFANGDDFGDGWGDGNGSGGGGFGTNHGDPTAEVANYLSDGKRSGDSTITRDGIDSFYAESTRESRLQSAKKDDSNFRYSLLSAGSMRVDGSKDALSIGEGYMNLGKSEEADELIESEGFSGNLIQGETMRREAGTQDADAQLLEGRKLYADGKYGEAVEKYNKTLNLLPAGEIAADRRHAYTGHLVDGSIALSQNYRRTGRYAEARETLSKLLAKDPLNVAAKQQLEYLDDPIRTNPVLSSEHTQDTEKVRKHLYRAQGYNDLGKYDEADTEYKEILRVDRYNKAARRGMQKIASMKSDYYRAAYDHTRAELLMEVDKAWEIAVPPNVNFDSRARGSNGIALSGKRLDQGRDEMISEEKRLASKELTAAFETRNINLLVAESIALADDLKSAGNLEDAKAVLKFALKKGENNITLKAKLKELEIQKEKPVTEEISAADQTHSTFSLNVSDASYKLAKAALLERGEWPAAESVRTEEFINAFDYGDPKPSMAQKVACVQEQAVHPFVQQRNLLRVSMSTAAQGRSTPLNIVVLLDQSGSMERPDRAATVLRAMEELGKQLGPNDRVSLMSFARETRLLVDDLSGDRAGELVKIMKNRPSEGGTNLEQAVQVAQQHLLARQKKGVQSRIVVLTDGAANLGNANPENMTAMVEKMRDAEIAFDACGIGFDGLDDGILEALTRKGDGRYYVLDKPEDAGEEFGKQIAGALRPAAKNVKVQLVFNPDRVGKYKLIGFEKHRLKKEDFRNDAVDAAEMAAEESGSALYQIEAMADGSGALGTVFVRFQDMATGQMVERSWTIPYQQNAPSLAASKPSIQLAAVAGLLGEKLHQSDAGSVDFSQMNEVLGNLNSQYSGNKKVQELLQMVNKVK